MEKNLFKFLGIFESNTLTAALCAASPTKKFNYFFFPLPTLLKFIYSLLLFTETVLSYSVKCSGTQMVRNAPHIIKTHCSGNSHGS